MKKGNILKVILLGLIGLVLQGCGGYQYKPNTNTITLTPSQDLNPMSTSTGTTSVVTDTIAHNPGVPVISMRIDKTGYDVSYTYQVRVKNVLKIKFKPGLQNKTVAGTGWSPNYSQLAVYISIEDDSRPTSLLSNGLLSPAEESPVLDFSTSFRKTCATGDTACRQLVTITVNKPNYDYWCYNFGQYCPHTHVWDTHPWNGTLSIQTDDTNAFSSTP